VGAPRHAAQLATWQPVPLDVGTGAGVAVGLLLRPSVDAPLATQLDPVAVCTSVKPCGRNSSCGTSGYREPRLTPSNSGHMITIVFDNR
jgi:hypothetical protein